MKKSDVAIYISAILTLVLTTFVVFSTQKVTYENKVDDLLKNSSVSTNHLVMATDPNTSSDAHTPLFRNRLPDESSDIDLRRAEVPQKSSLSEKSFADTETAPAVPVAIEKKQAIFDDEAQDRIIGRPFTPNTASDSRPQASEVVSVPKAPEQKSVEDTSFKSTALNEVKQSAPEQAAHPRVSQATAPVTAPRQNAVTGGGGERFHTVVYGDMLRTIAARYGTTTMKLIQLNNFSNPDLIYPGQKIRLP